MNNSDHLEYLEASIDMARQQWTQFKFSYIILGIMIFLISLIFQFYILK